MLPLRTRYPARGAGTQPAGATDGGSGLTQAPGRVGTVAVTLKVLRCASKIRLANAPVAPVLAVPAFRSIAKNETVAPETPRRSSSSVPLSSTEFFTLG